MSFCKPQVSFSSNFASLFIVMITPLYFFRSNLTQFAQKEPIKVENLRILGAQTKFTKFLSFLKQQISFSSDPASLFSVMRHNYSILNSWEFIYFQQREPKKEQIWWQLSWAVESLKFCILMGFFCPNNIKFQLKKYRRVISHDTEEWCKVLKKDLWFQIWHGEFV